MDLIQFKCNLQWPQVSQKSQVHTANNINEIYTGLKSRILISGHFKFVIISDFQTDLDGIYNLLLTKSTKKVLEEKIIDLNQKKKTKKANWTEITAIDFDQTFTFTVLYKYNLDVSWQSVDIFLLFIEHWMILAEILTDKVSEELLVNLPINRNKKIRNDCRVLSIFLDPDPETN